MIAEIYVENPAYQVDRPFDYLVPEKYCSIISVGIRVIVPFSGRKLLGFVTKIKEESEFETSKLKAIEEVLDLTPVLNRELLELGNQMAKETICSTICAYQAMLPIALKGKYEKVISLCEGVSASSLPFDIQELFQKKNSVLWSKVLLTNNLATIKKAISNGLLEVSYNVKNKANMKKERVLSVNMTKDELTAELLATQKNATAQKKALTYLIENPQIKEISAKAFLEILGLNSQSLKNLLAKNILHEKQIENYRDPYSEQKFEKTQPLQLSNDQTKAVQKILSAINEKISEKFLLFGITGSGKTEVYLQTISSVIENGKQAIMLVPEISLTPQMVTRFKGRFGNKVAVLHSRLSIGEKYDEWRKIYRGEVDIVVGARSAIFAPFTKLGVIIIDEEHESAYKQEENPRYHVTDIAKTRGEFHNCPVVFGSATPRLETFARAKKGVYTLLTLPNRINARALPPVTIVDMRQELRNGNRSMFSEKLYKKIANRIELGQQIVLLLNRRGYSAFIMCRECGTVITCENCDVSMTYHRTNNNMKCHYCGNETRVPKICPSCSSEHIRFFGTGTQKVEEEINKQFVGAKVIRMDVDTTSSKGAHERLLKRFEQGEANILLGTQMIAKGLDFPNITLVGVLAADASLHIADFRSSEKTFQLLTQVSGRAGRHELPGEVIIQTYAPEHYSITLAASQNYLDFFYKEMQMRHKSQFPPYTYLTHIMVSHPDQLIALDASHFIVQFIKTKLDKFSLCFGPVAAPVAKVQNRYRFQCLIKYRNEQLILQILTEINDYFGLKQKYKGVFLTIDRNPMTM